MCLILFSTFRRTHGIQCCLRDNPEFKFGHRLIHARFLSKGRLCWQAAPTGVWEIHANTKISVPWATRPDSTGYYADGKEQSERPTPFDTNNPEVQKAGLVSSSGGIKSPNMHCANKSTAAGTALAIAYKKSIWEVSMADFAVFSIAPETPFERLAYYTVPDLAACDECICATR